MIVSKLIFNWTQSSSWGLSARYPLTLIVVSGGPKLLSKICPNGSDLTAVLSDLDSDPERIAAISRRNAKEALLRHDWVYRWNEMFRVAGIEPSPHMAARERHLKDMADFVASAKKKADTAPKKPY
jgi:hypothetical protein